MVKTDFSSRAELLRNARFLELSDSREERVR
jgi:hypothetical protein